MEVRDESFSPVALALIGAPSSAGARRRGQEKAPAALRSAGLLEGLREGGLDVEDMGDLPEIAFRPDPEHPRRQNLGPVMEAARQAAGQVDRALAGGRLPVVLGGDCTLTIGVISALLRHRRRPGLLYFDGDADLNTPQTTTSGILDGMVMAHLLGQGAPELAGIGSRRPLMSREHVVLFGVDPGSGWIDPPEIEILERSAMSTYLRDHVQANPVGTAAEARRELEGRADALLVHLDVDVMNLAAADVPHPRGLEPEEAFAALKVLLASPLWAGLVVTELNADEDPEGDQARLLARGLAEALVARARVAGPREGRSGMGAAAPGSGA